MESFSSAKKEHKDIDAIELIEARSKEIQFIEESIKKSNKKTMLFQRLPFYKRRRNRNYDKRASKKFTYRKKDRHFLRTHTYYAKRFFMLKLDIKGNGENGIERYNDISIPLKRRIKSDKYIYKSQDRGFLFDESFRGGFYYDTNEFMPEILRFRSESITSINENKIELIPTLTKVSLCALSTAIDLNKYDQVQTIDNLYDVILTKSNIYIIGAFLVDCCVTPKPMSSILSIWKKENYGFYELKDLKEYQIYPDNQGNIQNYKILCERSQVMNIYQILISNSIIPICLEEIYRISIESDQMTVYDNIKSEIFNLIEKSTNKEIVAKYNRTPKSKKQELETDELYISKDLNFSYGGNPKYCVFSASKGSPERGGYLYRGELCVGRVIRSAYKFTKGKCFGLCAIYQNEYNSIELGNELSCKNIGQSNFYSVEIVKMFN